MFKKLVALQRIKMEYQKIANLFDNEINQSSKFRTRNLVQTNYESRETFTGNDIRFKNTMLRSNLCDYADACMLENGTITITAAIDDVAARLADEIDKGVTFKNCVPFVKCISIINNIEIDNAKDIVLQCRCTTWLSTVIIILKHQKVGGSTIKMIEMIIEQTLNHLNIK